MKRMPALLAVLVAILFAPPILSEEGQQAGTYILGTWQVSGSIGDKKVNGTMTVEPTADGKAFFFEWSFESDGEVRNGAILGGIDPATGAFVEYGFVGDDHWINTYPEPLGDELGKTTGTRKGTVDGKPYEGKIEIDRSSQDRFEYRIDSEDGPISLVFERKAATDAKKAFQDFVDYLAHGYWTATGEDGQIVVNKHVWEKDAAFATIENPSDSVVSATCGIDPRNGKFTIWGFLADGSLRFWRLKSYEKGTWTFEGGTTSEDNETSETLVLEKINDDETRSELMVPGEPSQELTWKRQE